ncbi:DUF3443 family protein [Cupriavidus necator]
MPKTTCCAKFVRAAHTMILRPSAICVVLASVMITACGGGGGDVSPSSSAAASSSTSVASSSPTNALPTIEGVIPAGSNVLKVTVTPSYVNGPMASITICEPGTANCRTIDNMLIDTGSVGVRVKASVLAGLLLPAVLNDAGYPAAECLTFASATVWGAVRSADVQMAGEVARNLPLQVTSDPSIPSGDASGCPAQAGLAGENGIIGIGYNAQDCGFACTVTTNRYYSCPPGKSSCSQYKMTLGTQVANPIMAFNSPNNNGVIFSMPSIPDGGAAKVTGTLIFGIGTQANNTVGGLTVLPVSQVGTLSVILDGIAYPKSKVDSGTNYSLLPDPSLPTCTSGGYFCPPTTTARALVVQGANSAVTKETSLTIVNRSSQMSGAGASNVVHYYDLGKQSALLGLSFFYGKTIAFGMNGANTSVGVGPFVAL